MNLKLTACLLALALLVGWMLVLLAGGREGTVRGSGEPDAPAMSPTSVELREPPPAAPSHTSLPVAREAARPVDAVATTNAWRGELAGLIGRVVEDDGAPVPAIRVALLEVESSQLFNGSLIEAEEPSIELEETLTDHEGRFVLGGARASAFHGLGVDLGGPRATIRVIDHALPHRERTDIGDVVLAPYGVLSGRLIDESGAPVAGARIRAGHFPEQVLAVSVHEFRSDSLIAVNRITMGGEGQEIIDLPDWVRRLVDRLPVPTTWSDSDGRFRLAGVPLTEIIGAVDKRGHVGLPLGPFEMSGPEIDVGEQVLARGRRVRGVVEDPFGEPASGVEVFAGAEVAPGVAAILQPCGTTDDEGRFELSGVAETGQIVAIARRARHEPWATTVSARPESLLIELEGTVQLTVNVRDAEGKPLSGARLRLAAGRPPGGSMGFSEAFLVLPRPISPEGIFREVEPGRYVNASLGSGHYDLTVHAPGLAPATQQVECLAQENEVTLTCGRGHRIELRVVDAATKAPIAGARGSILRVGGAGFSKLSVASTDPEGHAWLGPVQTLAAGEVLTGFLPSETMVLVQHPSYGDHSATLEPDLSPLIVALEAGGTLASRVHWGGAIPTRLYMLTLEFRGADGFLEMFHMPRFGLTDLAGECRLANLAPGRYRVALSERFLDQDPLGLMNEDFDPATLHRAEVEIRNGETTELVIDLTPTGRGETARIVGRVRWDGRSLEGAEVSVRGNESLQVLTDARGRFETPSFAVRDSTRITIAGDIRTPDGETRRMQLLEESVELSQDDVHEIDLDLYPLTLRVEVVDGAGHPVPEASVNAQFKDKAGTRGSGNGSTTNSLGEAELLILKSGDFLVTAGAKGFGKATTPVTVPAEGLTERVSIRLPRSVPCAGRILVGASSAAGPGRGSGYFFVRGEGHANSAGTRLQPPDYAFELEGLPEGEYKTWIYLGGRRGEEGTLVLGPEGERDLVLEFIPAEDRPPTVR